MPITTLKPTLVLLIASVAFNVHASLENQVKDSPVPYLAMHGTDPVHWQQWNADTLQRARADNKPLFLSIGFFACYWCHVMQRESFRDADIARLLNANFIPVIVDRELEPELDAQLIEFVERYRGSAGWPLNVIVTPEGYPVLGGVYFPRAELRTVLDRVAESWKNKRQDLERVARAAAQDAQRVDSTPAPNANVNPDALIGELIERSLRSADRLSGGFGEQSKFPMSSHLLALMRAYEATRNKDLGNFLSDTLVAMAKGGLRDHLDGGFFRYTTDPAWRTPHFEKMLYDQALLARVYLRGATVFQRDDFAAVARETLDFALAQLRSPGGMFYSSLSAVDERGDEGAYYLWDDATLTQILSPNEQAVVRRFYGLTDVPEFERGHLLIPFQTREETAKTLQRDARAIQVLLDRARGKLRDARAKRFLPVDTKLIAGWNGLMLAALTEAARLPDATTYAEAAHRLRNALAKSAWRDDVLVRDTRAVRGTLEDYAYIAVGLVAYARQFNSMESDVLARRIVAQAWKRFQRDGVWSFSERSLLPPRGGRAAFDDGALPSASAYLLDASFDLAARLGDRDLDAAARDALARARATVGADPFGFASHVMLEKR